MHAPAPAPAAAQLPAHGAPPAPATATPPRRRRCCRGPVPRRRSSVQALAPRNWPAQDCDLTSVGMTAFERPHRLREAGRVSKPTQRGDQRTCPEAVAGARWQDALMTMFNGSLCSAGHFATCWPWADARNVRMGQHPDGRTGVQRSAHCGRTWQRASVSQASAHCVSSCVAAVAACTAGQPCPNSVSTCTGAHAACPVRQASQQGSGCAASSACRRCTRACTECATRSTSLRVS